MLRVNNVIVSKVWPNFFHETFCSNSTPKKLTWRFNAINSSYWQKCLTKIMQSSFLIGTRACLTLMMMMIAMMDASFTFGVNWTSSLQRSFISKPLWKKFIEDSRKKILSLKHEQVSYEIYWIKLKKKYKTKKMSLHV